MSGLCSIFPGNTYFLRRYFKNGTVKTFIDAEETDIESQGENVLVKAMKDVWDSFPPQHVDSNNCCLLLITEYTASSNKHVKGESS